MITRQFITDAMRTLATPDSLIQMEIDLCHAAIGLQGEWNEYFHASTPENALEELADIYWYVALACHALNIESIASRVTDIDEDGVNLTAKDMYLDEQITAFSDEVKRVVFYRKPIDRDKMEEHLSGIDTAIIQRHLVKFQSEDESESITDLKLQEAVIEKLKARYPDKFDLEKTLNRDTNKEMKSFDKLVTAEGQNV